MAPAAILDTFTSSQTSPLKPTLTSEKRSLSQISTADEPPSSPSKRHKVSFSPHVDVHIVDEFGEKSAAVVREEITIAIRQHEQGESEKYDEIKAVFAAEPRDDDLPSSNVVRKHLLGLIENVASLKRSCADLVHTVLENKWLAQDDAVVHLYTRFLGHLVSSQRGYLPAVLNMLVENLAHISTSASKMPGRTLTDRLKLQARVHSALKYLMHLIPSGSTALASAVSSSFPFPTDTKRAHTEYVRNLLRVMEYAPELKAEVLDLIVERLIRIDVQVQTDIEDLEEEVGELLDQSNQLDPYYDGDDEDSDLSDNESASDSEDEDEDEEIKARKRIKTVRSCVEKTDALLDTLFTFYTPSFDKNSQSHTAHSMFNQLLTQFQKTILPTYRSRHTQFLLFHFAQTSAAFATSFIDKCLSNICDKTRSPVIRASAAAYVASFVARGAKLTPDIVVYAFDRLAAYLETLRKAYEPQVRAGPDLRKFSTYYVTAQALVYIFCFRWRDLLASAQSNHGDLSESESDIDNDDLDAAGDFVWAAGVKDVFAANFHSRLNPLKLVAPSIVEEFARIALHTRFMYVYAIVDANKRVRILSNPSSGASTPVAGVPSRETALSAQFGGNDGGKHLEAYFPFDPYRLPRSRRWLVGDYKEWQGVGDEAQAEAGRDSSDEAEGGMEMDVLEDEDEDVSEGEEVETSDDE